MKGGGSQGLPASRPSITSNEWLGFLLLYTQTINPHTTHHTQHSAATPQPTLQHGRDVHHV